MATEDPSGHTARASTLGPWPSGAPGHVALAAGPPSGRSGRGVPRLGERISAAMEKRGPYMVMRVPSIQAKLRECGPLGLCLGGLPGPPGGPRSPARAIPERYLQPIPVPKNLFDKSGFLAFGRNGGVGKTPLTWAL